MAFVDVELTDEEKAALGRQYVKFNAIGDKFIGLVLSTQKAGGTYAKPNDLDYVVKTKNAAGEVVEMLLSPNGDLAPKFKKANVRKGSKIKLEYVADRDVGKESPMKVIKCQVDNDGAVAPGSAPSPDDAAAKAKAAAEAKAKAEAAAKKAAEAEDDINF